MLPRFTQRDRFPKWIAYHERGMSECLSHVDVDGRPLATLQEELAQFEHAVLGQQSEGKEMCKVLRHRLRRSQCTPYPLPKFFQCYCLVKVSTSIDFTL